MTQTKLENLLRDVLGQGLLIQGVLSSPRLSSAACLKISCHPILIKQNLLYQITSFFKDKTTHTNVSSDEAIKILHESLINNFKQGVLFTSIADYHLLINKKKEATILQKSPSKQTLSLTHNRPKNHLLTEGTPIPFLIELGVMTREGKVIAKKSDKFKQINRFLEMIDDVIPHLKPNHCLQIIDFGCGKAYLTFALYHYLHNSKHLPINVVGLDLKESVIQECQQIADKLRFDHLSFKIGDITHYQPTQKIDMVITLHACDTATDAAIDKAIKWEADVILSVPCCQHELYHQVSNEQLTPLLHHGILKERFAALATDAARAQLLEIMGYHTQILEFIDMEHTPKNLLIRATRRQSTSNAIRENAIKLYQDFKKSLNITPALEKMLGKELGL